MDGDMPGEINPGGYEADPDYSPESWAEMSLDDYMITIANYGDRSEAIREAIGYMPDDVYDEYAELDFPGLPVDLRPDYEEPVLEDAPPEEEA